MTAFRRMLLLSAATAWTASVAAAQQTECKLDLTKPGELQKAFITLQTIKMGKPEQRADKLKDAVKSLTEKPDRFSKNMVGHDVVLGLVFSEWAEQLGTTVAPRATLGFKDDPTGSFDLANAIDSVFTAAEKAAGPACTNDIRNYRRSQAWLNATNGAIQALNAQKYDSAQLYAQRAVKMNPDAPYGWQVLAAVAQQKNDMPTTVSMLRRAAESAKGDTALAETRRQALYNIALISASQVGTSAKQGDPAVTAAIADINAYLAEAGSDPNASTARAELARIQSAAGDTAAVIAIYQKMLAEPSGYSDTQLFEAGLQAARAQRDADAEKLFRAGLEKNPQSRDGLFNLVAVQFNQQKFAEMLPNAKRLVAIDPNYPENWRMLAAAYQGVSKAQKDPKVKRAQTDSLVKAFEKYQNMPIVVTFTLFRHDGPKHTLKGTIENRSDAAKPATLKVEFLDASGNVVATKEAAVGTIAPKGKQDVTVEVEHEGITSYRYAPIG